MRTTKMSLEQAIKDLTKAVLENTAAVNLLSKSSPEPEKPKRTRRTKKQIEADEKAAASKSDTENAGDDISDDELESALEGETGDDADLDDLLGGDDDTVVELTKDDILKAVKAFAGKGKKHATAAKKLIESFDAKNVSQITEDDYPAFMEKLDKCDERLGQADKS